MDNEQMFVIFFAGLVSMQFHPKNYDKGLDVDLVVKDMAYVADRMVLETRRRYKADDDELISLLRE